MNAPSPTQMAMPSGRYFDLANPRVEDIHWPDVAEMLAKLARWGGATPGYFFSVAQHSLGVENLLAQRWRGYGLLHDVPEIFITDLIRPAQRALGDTAMRPFRKLHGRLDGVVHAAAGLKWPLPAEGAEALRNADNIMLATEARWLMPPGTAIIETAMALPTRIIPHGTWQAAAEAFLQALRLVLPSAGA